MMMLIDAFLSFANAPKKKMEEESHKCHGTVTVSCALSPLSRKVPATTTIGWRLEIDSRQAARFYSFAKSPDRIWGSRRKYQDPKMGHPVTQLVEALRYKSEGHGFDFQ